MILFIAMYVLLFLLFAVILTSKEHDHLAVLILFITGFTIYSGIGIALFEQTIDSSLYLVQYVLASTIFLIVGIRSAHVKSRPIMNDLDRLIERYSGFVDAAAIAYVGTFVFVLLYEQVGIERLFDIARLFRHYTATSFTLRVARNDDAIFRLITVQIRGLLKPLYFIYLYKNRKKAHLFILMYLLPIYCNTVANSYISRNEMAVYASFLLLYLISEKKMNPYIAVIGVAIALPAVLYAFVALQNIRSYGEGASIGNVNAALHQLFLDECGYPQYYPVCDSMSSGSRTINYFLYVLTSFVPSKIQHQFGINTIDLAREFTERLIGLRYGDSGYYILLPSVLGEGIILFGKTFSWLYLGFYGIVVFWMLRVLRSNSSLYYLKLSFLLDFLREFRGGSQYLMTGWLTTLVPFIILVLLVGFLQRRNAAAVHKARLPKNDSMQHGFIN